MNQAGLALTRLWVVPGAPRRGPKPKLSLAVIVDAAVTLARAERLAAVTMARVADSVGCSKMALYRHVTDRGDLLAAMLDRAIGLPPALTGSLRERFETLWEALLGIYATDPWLLELPTELDALTPQNVAWIDAALSVLEGSTLPPRDRLATVLLVTENIRFDARRTMAAGRSVDDLDFLLRSVARAAGDLPPDRFPHLAALADDERPGHDDNAADDAAFVRTLMLRSVAGYFPDGATA